MKNHSFRSALWAVMAASSLFAGHAFAGGPNLNRTGNPSAVGNRTTVTIGPAAKGYLQGTTPTHFTAPLPAAPAARLPLQPMPKPISNLVQYSVQAGNPQTQPLCTGTCTADSVIVNGHSAFGNSASVDGLDPDLGPSSSVTNVYETATDSSGAARAISSDLVVNPSGDVSGGSGYFSVLGYASTEAGNSSAFGSLTGGYFGAMHRGTGSLSWLAGLGSDTENTGGGNVDTLVGENPYLYNSAGSTANNMWGMATATLNDGTVTNMAGIEVLQDVANSGTITNLSGVHIEGNLMTVGGNIENFYGLKIEDVALFRPANHMYAIQTGKGLVEFGDVVKMDPSPFASLPPCTPAAEGSIHPVNDSVYANWGAPVVGGGSSHVLAYCNGIDWTVK